MNTKNKPKRIIASLALSLGLVAGIASHNTQQVSASTIESDSIYVVQSGDCLWTIAQRFNMTLKQLEALNGLNDFSIIYPDDRLKLVGDATVSVTTGEETGSVTYVDPATDEQAVNTQEQQVPADNYAQNNNYQAQAQAQSQPQTSYSQNVSGSEANAKAWIAQRESGGSYNARNGRYIGKFQLDSSYLNGDYSPANQERVANNYVANRYGSWVQAQAFWQANGWY